jgi:iron(III) transport system ATP-binding protein
MMPNGHGRCGRRLYGPGEHCANLQAFALRGRRGLLSYLAMVGVRTNAITKKFGATTAVDQVDLQVEPGELYFLLGPSGCGKTTLLRMIAGLAEPTGGQILFGDRDVTRLATGKRNTAMVFQSYALWPHLTVGQNVAFGLDVRRVSREEKQQRVAEALRRVQMTDLAERRPAQLSGGQQQRVALARALVVSPDVLLLDEPLSNLDAKLRLEMRTAIRRICKAAQITAIYVTHDQSEALSMADRIAVMRDGRLEQVGTPEELYNRPHSRFVADFLGTTNFIPAMVQARQPGRLTLECPAGAVVSTVYPEDVPEAGNVTCSVRPEAMRLLDDTGHADNAFAGRHVETVYLGDAALHTFELHDGLRVEVNEVKPRHREWGEGETRIGFDASDVVVLVN